MSSSSNDLTFRTIAVNFHTAQVLENNHVTATYPLSAVSFTPVVPFPTESELFILQQFFCVTEMSETFSCPEVSEAKDTITFRLLSSLERKASSPKASLRTKQEDASRQRRSPSSPSQGKYHHVLHNGFLSTF